MITIYTDGGAYNNNGHDKAGLGAYAFLEPIREADGYVKVYTGRYDTDMTNNKAEMLAVIYGINTISEMHHDDIINVITDSGYVYKGVTDPAYLDKWISNGWRTSNKQPVLNKGMWMVLNTIRWHNRLRFTHIKGHNKDRSVTHAYWNDICDRACTYTMNCLEEGFKYTLLYSTITKSFTVMKYEPGYHGVTLQDMQDMEV